jgi:PAS domain S-box-containing protein
MATRERLVALLERDADAFRDGARAFLAAHGEDPDRVASDDALLADAPLDATRLSAHERELVRRVRILDDAPLGLTVAGPAYEDNPVIYVNRTFRELTGYTLEDVRGENLRLLQGPDTDPGAVDALREATEIWEPVTVELLNYRADGTPFRNRVSLVPHSGETGRITNWVGIQERVED